MTTGEEYPLRSVDDVPAPFASVTLKIKRSRGERNEEATRTAIFVHILPPFSLLK